MNISSVTKSPQVPWKDFNSAFIIVISKSSSDTLSDKRESLTADS